MTESKYSKDECIFCKLLTGTEPVSFVYRDNVCTAFMDIKPVNAGHVLVIPNEHASFMKDLDANVAAHLMRVAHKISASIRKSTLRCEGINLFLADGEAAMQEVFHVHLHILPRYKGDGFGLRFGPHYSIRPRSELDEAARLIWEAIEKSE